MSIEAPNSNKDKSQAELRATLEAKLYSLEPILTTGLKEYEQALDDGVFDDQDGEEEGSGEKRKLAIQNKLTTLVNQAQKMKDLLDSGEELPQEPILDIDTIKSNYEAFLEEIFEKPKNGFTPTLIKHIDQDYITLKDDIDIAKFGEYTLNPETQNIDFENIPEAKIFIPDLSAFGGKTLHEVAKYLIDTYAGNYKIPGIEYWKWLRENPTKSPQKIQDGNYYFNFGSLVRSSSGHWSVPFAGWSGSGWLRNARRLDRKWNSNYRVVLLEI